MVLGEGADPAFAASHVLPHDVGHPALPNHQVITAGDRGAGVLEPRLSRPGEHQYPTVHPAPAAPDHRDRFAHHHGGLRHLQRGAPGGGGSAGWRGQLAGLSGGQPRAIHLGRVAGVSGASRPAAHPAGVGVLHSRQGTPIKAVIAVVGGNCAPTGARADPSRHVNCVSVADALITCPTQEAAST